MPAIPSYADGGRPPANGLGADIQEAPVDLQVISNSEQVTLRGKEGDGAASTNAVGGTTVGGMTVEWSSGVGYTPTQTRHEFVQTARVSGTGTYATEAHAALLPCDTHDGCESIFDSTTNGCAEVALVNATSRTCTSSLFSASSGSKWLIVSGHQFDVGNNGVDATCDGCIDWVFVHP